MTLWQYTGKRLLNGIVVWISVTIFVFFLFQLLPGDPARLIAGQRADEETIQAIRKELGLDDPVGIRLLRLFNDLLPLSVHRDDPRILHRYDHIRLVDLGEHVMVLKVPYLSYSFMYREPVLDLILRALPNTLVLAVAAMILALILGLTFGSLSALFQGTFVDAFIVAISSVGISLPSFLSALIVAWVFGYLLRDILDLPLMGSFFESVPGGGVSIHWKALILPAFTLGIRPTAILTQITRSSILDVMHERYVLTGYAKGLSATRVFFRYIFRNALNPVATVVTGWFAALLTGAFFVEYVFSWKGIGLLAVEGLQNLDLPLVMGITLFASTVFVFINIFVDIIYAFLDPRVSYQ